MKPRISYAEFQASRLPDFDSMVYGETKLLLEGVEYIFEGAHYDSIVWLRKNATVYAFKQKDVAGKLKLASTT